MSNLLVGSQKPKAVYVAGAKAKKVMVGTGTSAVQVWTNIVSQGMRATADVGSNWFDYYGKWAKPSNLAADPAYPSSVIVDNELVITGSGIGRVELGVRWDNAATNTGCRLVRGGVVVQEFWAADQKKASGSIPNVTVSDGDHLVLEIRQGYGGNKYYAADTYLRFIPG